jgi:hypothetical protein
MTAPRLLSLLAAGALLAGCAILQPAPVLVVPVGPARPAIVWQGVCVTPELPDGAQVLANLHVYAPDMSKATYRRVARGLFEGAAMVGANGIVVPKQKPTIQTNVVVAFYVEKPDPDLEWVPALQAIERLNEALELDPPR